jgi:uncharacterized low-complexity protein
MSKTTTPATALIGVALAGSLGLAQAEGNPFVAEELGSGYMHLAEADTEGKCGEGKCGEGKCGTADGKDEEGKCGSSDGKDGEGKCGGSN